MLIINIIFYGIIYNIINIPFDNGANMLGSKNSPKVFAPYLNFLDIDKKFNINTNNFISNIIGEGYRSALISLHDNKIPITIGGDHTVAVSSVFASNKYCNIINKTLGVLWCDAHADFNTVHTSYTKNIHGMPVSILCGHTLEYLEISDRLLPSQFLYYGLRDIDSMEFLRFQDYNMAILDNNNDLDEWINNYDYIHVSFDIDCLDPSVTECVNTPVKNGKTVDEVKDLFTKIKLSNKLCALDIVEYNPNNSESPEIIIDIVKELLV